MILVDTSVWVDHLRYGDELLSELLLNGRVLSHPFVIGELAMGNLKQREPLLSKLHDLPNSEIAGNGEVLAFVDRHSLYGIGIGYIDAHLLASVRLTPGATLWTRDRRLAATAEGLSVAARLNH